MMKLNKTQIIVLACIALLTVILYLLPKKVLTNNKEGANRDKPAAENTNPTPDEHIKSVYVILSESIATLSDNEKKDLILDTDTSKAAVKKALAAYTKLKNLLGVAVCKEKMPEQYSEKEIGMAYYASFQQSEVEENKKSIAAKAATFLQPSLDKSPDDIAVKCALAACYVNSSANPMNGIMLLRDVIAKDSTNETALLLLGEFAVKSGQTDKAIGRFESLIRHYPDNIKYSLYLAQLFSDRGDRDKALETLTNAKKKAVRKTTIDSLNSIINQLK